MSKTLLVKEMTTSDRIYLSHRTSTTACSWVMLEVVVQDAKTQTCKRLLINPPKVTAP